MQNGTESQQNSELASHTDRDTTIAQALRAFQEFANIRVTGKSLNAQVSASASMRQPELIYFIFSAYSSHILVILAWYECNMKKMVSKSQQDGFDPWFIK